MMIIMRTVAMTMATNPIADYNAGFLYTISMPAYLWSYAIYLNTNYSQLPIYIFRYSHTYICVYVYVCVYVLICNCYHNSIKVLGMKGNAI